VIKGSKMRTESFSKVTTTRCRRLEKQPFVLLRAQLDGDLATKLGTVADNIVTRVLLHLVVDLVRVRHDWIRSRTRKTTIVRKPNPWTGNDQIAVPKNGDMSNLLLCPIRAAQCDGWRFRVMPSSYLKAAEARKG
jgi:hypothetical protein